VNSFGFHSEVLQTIRVRQRPAHGTCEEIRRELRAVVSNSIGVG